MANKPGFISVSILLCQIGERYCAISPSYQCYYFGRTEKAAKQKLHGWIDCVMQNQNKYHAIKRSGHSQYRHAVDDIWRIIPCVEHKVSTLHLLMKC